MSKPRLKWNGEVWTFIYHPAFSRTDLLRAIQFVQNYYGKEPYSVRGEA